MTWMCDVWPTECYIMMYLYNKSRLFPWTIPGFEGSFCSGWHLWPAGVHHGSQLSRLVSACCSPFGRGTVVEGARTMVKFGGEGAMRYRWHSFIRKSPQVWQIVIYDKISEEWSHNIENENWNNARTLHSFKETVMSSPRYISIAAVAVLQFPHAIEPEKGCRHVVMDATFFIVEGSWTAMKSMVFAMGWKGELWAGLD